MQRVVEQRLDRRLLDLAAGIHHHHALGRLGDHAEVVGDQHDRGAGLLLEVEHQVEDLRLDGDVERRGRLVGDQHLRIAARAPWRSSPAGACRRRAGADIRRAGAGRRRCAPGRASRAPARAPPSSTRPCGASTFSAICVPTVSTGLRLVIGSWKIIEMRWPRRRFIASSLSVVSSSPSNLIEPAAMRPVSGGIRRRIESAVTDLPQPDSPTMPSVSPRAEVERHAVDRAHHAVERVELRVEVADLRGCAVTAASPGAGRAGRAGRRPAGSPPAR